jgi:hypothetical protein
MMETVQDEQQCPANESKLLCVIVFIVTIGRSNSAKEVQWPNRPVKGLATAPPAYSKSQLR